MDHKTQSTGQVRAGDRVIPNSDEDFPGFGWQAGREGPNNNRDEKCADF